MAIDSLIVKIQEKGHLIGPMAMISIVFLILVPLPPFVLDFFFTINIIMAVSILLITTYINDAVDFLKFIKFDSERMCDYIKPLA